MLIPTCIRAYILTYTLEYMQSYLHTHKKADMWNLGA